jgi:putative component of toxin-antitoxin plasmid stabilization module
MPTSPSVLRGDLAGREKKKSQVVQGCVELRRVMMGFHGGVQSIADGVINLHFEYAHPIAMYLDI